MRRTAIPFSPAEAHGIAVGLGSALVNDAQAHWQAAVYADLEADDVLAGEVRALLDEVFAVAFTQLADESFGLQLFLPEEAPDQLPLAEALRDWARGFLYGVGLSGQQLMAVLSEEGREALQDFYDIANLDIDDQPLSEEDQQAAAELEEFMRVAAMLIHEEARQGVSAGEGFEQH